MADIMLLGASTWPTFDQLIPFVARAHRRTRTMDYVGPRVDLSRRASTETFRIGKAFG